MNVFRGSRPVATILESLNNAGIKLAVLSDYAQVEERLDGLGIAPSYFDLITSSETAGALKPSPKPFLDIASKWGISPDKILVVGDRNDTDGEAARAAGMKFLKVNNRPASDGKTWNEAVEELKLLC
jgi:HAD superfamily hydrolase (TIGR01549 family)